MQRKSLKRSLKRSLERSHGREIMGKEIESK
jgi:hypothetical protein